MDSFALIFCLIVGAGGTVPWQIPMNCTVLQIQTDSAILIQQGINIGYPGASHGVFDSIPFVSTGAGILDSSFHVNVGEVWNFVAAAGGPFKAAIAYLPDPPNPGGA